jgi:hypothetical protein
MQGIYNYIPETNRAYRVYSVAAVLYLQFVNSCYSNAISPVKSVLYFYISTFCSMSAAPNMTFLGLLLLLLLLVVIIIIIIIIIVVRNIPKTKGL